MRRRRWEFWPEHRVGVGRKAFVMTAGYPARQDLLARIERVRLLELEEGVRRPVEDYGPDARASRRRGRAEMLHDAGAGDQRREDGGGSIQLGGRETEHGMGALDGEAGGGGCALGVGMQRHQRECEVETVAHVHGGSGEVSRACGGSADHGHRDEDTVQSVPTRRGAFAGWDAQGGELPYRRLHGDVRSFPLLVYLANNDGFAHATQAPAPGQRLQNANQREN